MSLERAVVDGIPLLWREPTASQSKRRLAIWLPGFSGSKESVEAQLNDLAEDGFVALSFDPYQHGERRVESQAELGARVVGNIRRHFWPILAQTADETLRIIDWAQAELGAESVCIGGISMGGDISIAAAGADSRISCVAACIATADWLRPGSCEPPGVPDSFAQLAYNRRNPLTNLANYKHCPAINFQCGAQDKQVPPDGAGRFVKSLEPVYASHPHKLKVELHTGVGHQFTPEMWSGARQWFRLNAS